MKLNVIWGCLILAALSRAQVNPDDEDEARAWLETYNANAQVEYPISVEAEWNYNTNLTDENLDATLEAAAVLAEWEKAMYEYAMQYNWQSFEDETTRREFSKLTDIGQAVLDETELNRLNSLRSEMERIYSTATVCERPGDPDQENCYPLDPDLTQIMATSDNWYELEWAWVGWRRESGNKMPDMYEEFAGLLNLAAEMNGYDDNGAYWRSWYEDPNFEADIARLWNETKPLYEQLHAFVRRKLMEKYSDFASEFPSTGQIPAHLLGNMWSQSWVNIEELVRPFPNKTGVDVTDEMIRQGYNATTMFELSEEFFTSLGLIPMTEMFWEKTMYVKPDDREVVCHASAWDFLNAIDFRVKQCTEVTMPWLITTHHEMGHIEYFLQYKEQPVEFRDGANPGFHEAIGDVMSLSVATPTHLETIGLLPGYVPDPEVDMNFLMQQALSKIAFLPFGYLIDQWRWEIFDGRTSRETYNERWWDVRCDIQGLSPPNARTNADFDAGSKYHVPANTPYIRYFVSHILQFQFHKALCDAAGYEGQLYLCDIYRSQEAGQLIGDMMRLGSSVPWPDALEAIVGSREMSALPLVEYFQPLLDWLANENEGWYEFMRRSTVMTAVLMIHNEALPSAIHILDATPDIQFQCVWSPSLMSTASTNQDTKLWLVEMQKC